MNMQMITIMSMPGPILHSVGMGAFVEEHILKKGYLFPCTPYTDATFAYFQWKYFVRISSTW